MARDVRLQKMLTDSGIASHRKTEELIAAGAVRVNGAVAKIGDKVDVRKDEVTVHGRNVVKCSKNIYIMLRKPRGFITAMSDEMDRKCVAELVSGIPEQVYPMGRLNRKSEGLLLMTNDGALANAMTHPPKHVSKTYRVTVCPDVTEDQLTQIAVGIVIDGQKTAPANVHIIPQEPGRVVLEIVLYEGHNREIRKMCETPGLDVARFKRTAVGPVRLGMFQPRQWRNLTGEEVKRLMVAAKEDKATEPEPERPKAVARPAVRRSTKLSLEK